jgi:hypothetical protein
MGGDLVILLAHSNFLSKNSIRLKTSDGVGSWTTIAQKHIRYFFSTLFA